jgi:lipopolysaccharide transport system permease protein
MKSYIVIKPKETFSLPNFQEWWNGRDLLLMLILRNIQIRYKQTLVGVGWALIQPLLTMIIFNIIFGNFAKIPSDGLPYPVFTLIAILPWQFFSTALNQGSISLVSMQGILTKVYFPRIFAPLSATLSGLVDFFISFLLLVLVMWYYGVYPGWEILTLPFFIFITILTSLSVSLWLSGLNVLYRDVKFTLPFMTQLWMYATPIVYPISIIPEKYQWLYMLNPMAGVIEGFRWALTGNSALNIWGVVASSCVVLCITVAGFLYFDRIEKDFADKV